MGIFPILIAAKGGAYLWQENHYHYKITCIDRVLHLTVNTDVWEDHNITCEKAQEYFNYFTRGR